MRRPAKSIRSDNTMVTQTRTKDGVTEHRHAGYDYWHPVVRVHADSHPPIAAKDAWMEGKTSWDMNAAEIYDLICGMSGQTHYTDLFGDSIVLSPNRSVYGDQVSVLDDLEIFSSAWAAALASVKGIRTTSVLFRAGVRNRGTDITITSLEDDVIKIYTDPRAGGRFDVNFAAGPLIIEAKRIVERGGASTIVDAVHILRVSGPNMKEQRYYDLIRLPSGGHIPVDILEEEYGVSWEAIVRIPLGKPRNTETFSCPICGERSYFAGVCGDCMPTIKNPCGTCEVWDACDCEHNPCEDYLRSMALSRKTDKAVTAANCERNARKEREHGEIRRLIKSGNWKGCRYIGGGDCCKDSMQG